METQIAKELASMKKPRKEKRFGMLNDRIRHSNKLSIDS